MTETKKPIMRAALLTSLIFIAAALCIAVSTGAIYYFEYKERVEQEALTSNAYVKEIVDEYDLLPWLIGEWYFDDGLGQAVDPVYEEKYSLLDLSEISEAEIMSYPEEDRTAISRMSFDELVLRMRGLLGSSSFKMMYYGDEDAVPAREDLTVMVCCHYGADRGDLSDMEWFDTFVDYTEADHPVLTRMYEHPSEKYDYEYFVSSTTHRRYLYIYTPIIREGRMVAVIIACREWGEDEKIVVFTSIKMIAISLLVLMGLSLFAFLLNRRYIRERTARTIETEIQRSEMEIAAKIQLSQMPGDFTE
ncbi:MAG: hypothetical protein IKR73_05235, partial [Oscillospiraceae bacterium]|nr:hypothetical protein [Oscillospiraceae bacterium]